MMHDAVQDAIAHLNLEIAEIQPVPDSFSSIVRLIELVSGEQLVLKIPYVKRKLFRELGALEAFHNDLPVPDLVDVWVPDDDRPGALLLSRLPGASIADPVDAGLARQMGDLLGRFHTHRLDHYGDREEAGNPDAHDWWAMLHDGLDRWKPHCMQAMPPDLYARSLALYRDLAADLPAPDGPCWVHNDYRPGNILVEDGKITGLIDFESARGGSADRDFTKVSHYVWKPDPATKPAFLAGYAEIRPVPDFERTLTLYQLHNALGGIAWCVRRTHTSDPFFRENLAVIKQLTEGKDLHHGYLGSNNRR